MIELQMQGNKSQPGDQPSDVNDAILSHVKKIEEILKAGHRQERIAVFDLDNTLIVGDIGEAVLARLVLQGSLETSRWREYANLVNTDRQKACCFAAQAMDGLSLKELVQTTLRVMDDDSPFMEIQGMRVMIPRAHQALKALVQLLQQLKYKTLIISASNQVSVQIIGSQVFGIAEEWTKGIRSRLNGDSITGELIGPIPVGEGKVDVYRRVFGDSQPLIVAGDSPMDVPLMQQVAPIGFCVWVGESRIIYEVARGRVARPQSFYYVVRPSPSEESEFQEQSSYL